MEGRHKEPPGSTLKEVDAFRWLLMKGSIFLVGVSRKKMRTEDDFMIEILFFPTQKIWKITHQISRNLRYQVSSTLDFVELGTPSLLRTTWFAGLARWSQFFAGFWELRPTKTNCKFNVKWFLVVWKRSCSWNEYTIYNNSTIYDIYIYSPTLQLKMPPLFRWFWQGYFVLTGQCSDSIGTMDRTTTWMEGRVWVSGSDF